MTPTVILREGKKCTFPHHFRLLRKGNFDQFLKKFPFRSIELVDNSYEVTDKLTTLIMQSKCNIRRNTRQLAGAVSCADFAKGLEATLSSHLTQELELDIVHGLTQLILEDATIARDTEAALIKAAETGDTYAFIGSVILYVIQRNNVLNGGDAKKKVLLPPSTRFLRGNSALSGVLKFWIELSRTFSNRCQGA